MPGAIDQVVMDGAVRYRTIRDAPPVGICGSGLLDLTAELLNYRVITPRGLLVGPKALKNVPSFVAERVKSMNLESSFFLTELNDHPIYFSAHDVRQIQLAKAAVQAGIAILMREMNVTPADIEQVFLAGAFGQRIQKKNLKRLGLLERVDESRILGIGNSALAGAQLALLSCSHRRRIEALSELIHYIELSGYPEFMDIYADSMAFPEHNTV
jgi:uncharacterized 2Fe-2S/4Fe-4S cluster protein (DUF4445 family)